MKRLLWLIGPIVAASIATAARASDDDEISLFDGSGKADAYIALDDEMTIYLWSGTPVAYLEQDRRGSLHVYGFNGEHLGWFKKGVIWDHQGTAACATKELLRTTQIEPIKGIRRITPIKSITQVDPIEPILSDRFGEFPCRFLLAQGGK